MISLQFIYQFEYLIQQVMQNQNLEEPQQIILPSLLSYEGITDLIGSEFILGYKNILIKGEQGAEWGLIKDVRSCAKIFRYAVKMSRKQIQGEVCGEEEYLEISANKYVLLRKQQLVKPYAQIIAEERVNKLIELIGGGRVGESLLKSAFCSYNDFRSCVEQWKEQTLQEPKEEVKDIVSRQFYAKKFCSFNLYKVPKVKKDTGNWDDQLITLKIEANN